MDNLLHRPLPPSLARTRVIVTAAVLSALSATASAQPAPQPRAVSSHRDEGGLTGQRQPRDEPGAPDFFVRQPRGWISVRGGWSFPRVSGELFSFVGDQLTIAPSDFRGPAINGEIGIGLSPRIAIESGVEVGARTIASEYRRFIASNGQPIEQLTRFAQTGLSAGIRVSPLGRGQRISRFAYIPRRVTPYAGAGVTAGHYAFQQSGLFVDFVDSSVFRGAFASKGWAVGPYARGGLDIQIAGRVFLNVDGRYTWLDGGLSDDFSGFDGIDLAGIRAATGVTLIF